MPKFLKIYQNLRMSSTEDVHYINVNQKLLSVVLNIQDTLSSRNAKPVDMKMAVCYIDY